MTIKDHVRITLLGDLTDRETNSLDVLSLSQDLLYKGGTVLAGNHEAALDAAMRFDDPKTIGDWCAMGGITFLRDVAIQNLFVEPRGINEPAAGVADYVGEGAWEVMLADDYADRLDMEHAFTWLRSEYARRLRTVFENTEILHRPLPGVLAVHAGLGSWWASMGSLGNVAEAWRTFRKDGDMRKINTGDQASKDVMAFREATWLRRDEGTDNLLGRVACGMLKNDNISLVVRGHDTTLNAVPTVFEERRGVYSIDADGGSRYGSDCYVKIVPEGAVIGGSAKEGEVVLGSLENGVFRPK